MIYKRSSYTNKNIAFLKNSINTALLVFVFSVSAHLSQMLIGVFLI